MPFLLAHLVPVAAIYTGVSTRAVVLCVVLFVGRMFFISAGYHRYFSHRAYKVSRPVQLFIAFGGTTAAQKGPLWWAAQHRAHHRWNETDRDPHTPLKGFWWSHVGWILSDRYSSTDLDTVSDLARYPEVRFVDRNNWIGPWMLAAFCLAVAGWSGLVVGFFLSTVLLWHATFSINSLAHVFGRRRYATSDTGRNNPLLALLTLGEGWHNNHHHYPTSVRQGFFWWEFDPSWYLLWAFSLVGLVKDPRRPPESVLAGPRLRDGAFDVGMFRSFEARAGGVIHASTAVDDDGQRARRDVQELVSASLSAADALARPGRRRTSA